MARLPERITTTDQFVSEVENSMEPVFLFILSNYYADFSPVIQHFAKTYPELEIYGITPLESSDVLKNLGRRLGVSTGTEFILWKNGIRVVEFSRGQLSDLMTVLQAIGVLDS
ncbi:hypothetical protein BDV33DRAFT_185118 [Aspergillus novoparasiticus]|uniref:Thioredoxin domain-containing protein n=1 Tax=Aspergillus novoparasiticus TaxID=986946 RepID=A0A5N6E843_9EURO|nr:hypothetical protein BDV33DRAFT_185118 [Aspergillus novoparasiticus]